MFIPFESSNPVFVSEGLSQFLSNISNWQTNQHPQKIRSRPMRNCDKSQLFHKDLTLNRLYLKVSAVDTIQKFCPLFINYKIISYHRLQAQCFVVMRWRTGVARRQICSRKPSRSMERISTTSSGISCPGSLWKTLLNTSSCGKPQTDTFSRRG